MSLEDFTGETDQDLGDDAENLVPETPESDDGNLPDDRSRDQVRASRRAERQAKRELEATRREVAALKAQFADMMRTTAERDVNETRALKRQAEDAYLAAFHEGDGRKVQQAQQIQRQLEMEEQAQIRRLQDAARQAERAAQPTVQPEVVRLRERFLARNPEIRSAPNHDMAIIMAIDQKLSAEGLDPADEEYWTELENRGRKAVPEYFAKPDGRRPAQTSRGAAASDTMRPASKGFRRPPPDVLKAWEPHLETRYPDPAQRKEALSRMIDGYWANMEGRQ